MNQVTGGGPHSHERWALFSSCSVLCRPVIIGLIFLETYDKPGMSCYRARLCAKELRDCWLARPMETTQMPFCYDEALSFVAESGECFPYGMHPVPIVVKADISAALKAIILREFVEHAEAMDTGFHFTAEEILEALDTLEG